MKEIKELATTTSTQAIQSEQWKKAVLKKAEARKRFEQIAKTYDLTNTSDVTVHIPKQTATLSVDTSAGEGSARTYTKLDNLSTIDLTVDQSDFDKGGVEISKRAVKTSRVDLVKEARRQLTERLANDVDTTIADTIASSSTKTVYAGGNAPGDVAAGDVLTPDLVADGIKELEVDGYVPKFLFIAPEQKNAFLKNSQFVNAAEYGDQSIIKNGEIGKLKHLGVRIIVSRNTPTFADDAESTSLSPNGHSCPLVGVHPDGGKVAIAIGYKEKPNIDYEYKKGKSVHRIYYDHAFDVKVIQSNAICKIKAADA